MDKPRKNIKVGDIVYHKNYPNEKAKVIIKEPNWIRVSHPYGWEWYQIGDCTLAD